VRFRHSQSLPTDGTREDGAFDEPAFGQHDALAGIGALDNLDVHLPAETAQCPLKVRPSVAVIGASTVIEQAEQRAHRRVVAFAAAGGGEA
jgi:hypothetical protein